MSFPSYAQSVSQTYSVLVSSVAGTWTTNLTANSCLLATVISPSNPTTVVDSAGNNYKLLRYGSGVSVWTAVTKLGAGTKPTVTATFSGNQSYASILIAEYVGVSTVKPIDNHVAFGNDQAGTSPWNGPTIGTRLANDTIVCIGVCNGTTYSAGAGWTMRNADNSPGTNTLALLMDGPAVTVGSYTPNGTSSASTALIVCSIALASQDPVSPLFAILAGIGENAVPTVPYNQVAGHCAVVCTVTYNVLGYAPTDTAGNVYVPIQGSDYNPSAYFGMQIWYAKNCLGHPANVITPHYNGGVNYSSYFYYDLDGVDTAAPLDIVVAGNSGSLDSSNFSTNFADEIVLLAYAGLSGYYTYAAGSIGSTGLSLDGVGGQGGTEHAVQSGVLVSKQTNVFASVGCSSSNIGTFGATFYRLPMLTGVPNSLMMMGCGV